MRDLFITCPYGFEDLLQKELKSLGIAKRVLWPLAEFNCGGKEDLYSNCRKINWSLFLNPQKTFAIDANVQHHSLTNSMFAALVVKDSICDFFRDKTGLRPSID